MENIEEKVLKMIQESNEIYRERGIDFALNKLLEAWEILPEPKMEQKMATVLASFIAKYNLNLKKFEESLHWGNILKESQTYKIDSGEGYFFCGEVYYEIGEKDKAIDEFIIAWKKSDGRIFKNKPRQYLALIKDIVNKN